MSTMQPWELINRRIPGWSDGRHYDFFRELLQRFPNIQTMLVLGVYHGRDIAYLLDILARDHPGRKVYIVGVDKFEDKPCADWNDTMLNAGNWSSALRGMPRPSYWDAVRNTNREAVRNAKLEYVEIVKADSVEYLKTCAGTFDCVYVDTSHDYHTVAGELRAVRNALLPNAIICGDDYAESEKWGVIRAVNEAFKYPARICSGHIWLSTLENLIV